MKLKKILIACLISIIGLSKSHSQEIEAVKPVLIEVDLEKEKGEMNPVWAWFGYDEPNYTYMQDGKKLLTEISQASPAPVYVRCHNLLTSGDGTPALKWGSTNVYTEDERDNPVYDWSIIDRIFDTYVERGMRPLVEIGFMPEALSVKPQPYKHSWRPGAQYSEIFTGWAYPPKDYEKWAELVYRWVRHSIDRYGVEKVKTWFWELWNEPNIGYWQGTTEEYLKLYDYSVDAVKRALPVAAMGGPHVTGPSWEDSAVFLKTFLEHCLRGKNYATGATGSPLDYIGFHAKGQPKVIDGTVQMNLGKQLRDISSGFEIVASFPELKHLPIIIGESDPEGCAACSMQDNPENAYRNGTMYSSYTAAAFARKFDLADHFGVNFKGAVTWAFEFENQPWFNGYRDLATNGVDKPVLNVFRMFGMMSGKRVEVSGDLAYDFIAVRDSSIRGLRPDINALASKDDHSASIMVWNYHDDNVAAPAAPIELAIKNIQAEQVLLHHYRIDQEHSNAYAVWQKMGSPQQPSPEQIAILEKAGQLHLLTSPEWIKIKDGEVRLKFGLPRQGVSLVTMGW
ncbi:beta-xylosidase [candidate division KSB1 bacterium RBG_16_48_16]|nr:MAG: beta-xylosidase [candidate division KSB1 bacterium RBG_16_48_16]